MKISAVSPFFGTTRMFGLPNNFCRYASSFLTSATSTGPLRFIGAAVPRAPGIAYRPRLSWEHVVHGAGRLLARGIADDLGRNAGDGDVVRHGLEHHRACRDARAMADLDIADDLCARPDQHAVGDLGMAVAVVLAGAAKRPV